MSSPSWLAGWYIRPSNYSLSFGCLGGGKFGQGYVLPTPAWRSFTSSFQSIVVVNAFKWVFKMKIIDVTISDTLSPHVWYHDNRLKTPSSKIQNTNKSTTYISSQSSHISFTFCFYKIFPWYVCLIKKAFSVIGTRLWNSLPTNIRNSSSSPKSIPSSRHIHQSSKLIALSRLSHIFKILSWLPIRIPILAILTLHALSNDTWY